jgi:hypothetical protein
MQRTRPSEEVVFALRAARTAFTACMQLGWFTRTHEWRIYAILNAILMLLHWVYRRVTDFVGVKVCRVLVVHN